MPATLSHWVQPDWHTGKYNQIHIQTSLMNFFVWLSIFTYISLSTLTPRQVQWISLFDIHLSLMFYFVNFCLISHTSFVSFYLFTVYFEFTWTFYCMEPHWNWVKFFFKLSLLFHFHFLSWDILKISPGGYWWVHKRGERKARSVRIWITHELSGGDWIYSQILLFSPHRARAMLMEAVWSIGEVWSSCSWESRWQVFFRFILTVG